MTNTVDDYDDLLDDGNHRRRRRAIVGTFAAAAVVIGVFALWATVLRGGGSAESAIQTTTVQRGSITKSISTSATAASQSTANLSFGTSGKVTAVNVAVGEEVKQGDVLAEVEATTLQDAVTRAQVNLSSAQNKLSQLLEGSTAAEIASANQSVIQAQQNLDKASQAMDDLYNPATDETNAAQQAVLAAQSQLTKAQQARPAVETSWTEAHDSAEAALDKAERTEEDAAEARADAEDAYNTCLDQNGGDETACGTLKNAYNSAKTAYNNAVDTVDAAEEALDDLGSGPDSDDITIADLAVQSAQLALASANDKLAALGNPSVNDVNEAQQAIDSASAALAAAEAKRDETYQGSQPEDISAQQGQVRLAQLSVREAQEDLGKAQLVAPFDGTVAAVNIAVGETAGSGTSSSSSAAIILNTPNALVLNLSIGESDLPSIKSGQNGTATFDALSGQRFPIVIDSVGTNATTTQGVVTYQAKAHIVSRDSVVTARPSQLGNLTEEQQQQIQEQMANLTDEQRAAIESRMASSRSSTDTASTARPVPGMNATVTVIIDEAQDVLTVPSSAVQSEGPASYVTVQKDDGSTEKVTVEIGLSDDSNTEITSGLEEGQTVIIPGATASSSPSSQTQQDRFFGGPSFNESGGGPGEGGIIQIGPDGGKTP
jgi:HlyD family secretion protein